MNMRENRICLPPNEPFWRNKPMTSVRLRTIIANRGRSR